MKHILVLSLSNLEHDPRVNRQIRALAGRFRVTAAGLADPNVEGVEFVHIPYSRRSFPQRVLAAASLALGRFEAFDWPTGANAHALDLLGRETFDLILANDLSALPLACKLPARHGVLFDAHEYSPREHEESIRWRLLFKRYVDYVCRNYLGRVAGMTTVCQSIADEYRANYGVAPEVVMNAPPFHDLIPARTGTNAIRMVHHGGAASGRKLELMLDIMDSLDERFHLDLILVPSEPDYLERLRALAGKHGRVRVLPPVPMRELPHHLNRYDLGLYLLPPNNFNNLYALPNKFFEFVQARLAIAIGPSPEMARLVRQYDCGIVADDFSPRSLARRLNELNRERIDYYKQRSHLAARELCFEKNSEVLVNMIDRLVGSV